MAHLPIPPPRMHP
ncbi:hypothetical protein ACHAXN_005485 [Cyclotella atomus]